MGCLASAQGPQTGSDTSSGLAGVLVTAVWAHTEWSWPKGEHWQVHSVYTAPFLSMSGSCGGMGPVVPGHSVRSSALRTMLSVSMPWWR
jgi:hypothetical protein